MTLLLDALHSATPRPVSPFTLLRAHWAEVFARRRKRNRIIRELSAYSDRELADIGLVRSDIRDVANGTFRRR